MENEDENKDVREHLERIKRELRDYLELSDFLKIDKETKEKTVNMYLENISKLIKKLKDN